MFDETEKLIIEEGMEVKSRFMVSLLTNVLRGFLSFITILILARGLGPASYGDFAFLMGSFVAIKTLLDLGTSSAFYTFLSQKPRGSYFILIYIIWLLVQFTLAMAIVGIVLPDDWINLFWVGQAKELVLISLTAVFMQQQAWQTMIHIGESRRQTQKIQMISLFFSLGHLLVVIVLWLLGLLSLKTIFIFIIVEYGVVICVAWKALGIIKVKSEPIKLNAVLRKYLVYCSPLIVYSLLGFSCNFADRWMLQHFGGSIEQGLFEIGYRFVGIGLIATTSMLNIFWKEISEANEKKDFERGRSLYRKTSRFLFTFGAVVCGFFIPWINEIIRILLGESYLEGAPVVMVMLLFAVFNGLAQVNITFIYASSKTKTHLVLGSICMIISIPLCYLFQAPKSFSIPGLELGSIGMACKMLIMIVLRSNLTGWWLSRSMGWKFDWTYQLISLSSSVFCGWGAFLIATKFLPEFMGHLVFKGIMAGIIYFSLVASIMWMMPWLIGMDRKEIRGQIKFFTKRFK